MSMLVLALSVIATPPCQRPIDLFQPMVAPPDGAIDVPTNVTPIVSGVFGRSLPELVVNGAPVDARIDTFETLDGFGETPWLRIVPDAELPADALVEVRFDDEVAATFSVGGARDDEAPPPPAVSFIGPYADGACVPYVEISVDGDAVSIAKRTDAPSLSDGSVVHGLGTGASVIVGGDANAHATVLVSSVDLAGNVSEPASVDVVFPPAFNGCTVCLVRGPVPPQAALIVALLLVVARRPRAPSS